MEQEERSRFYEGMYHRFIADSAAGFAREAASILARNVPPFSEIAILGIEDIHYPNDYATVLVPSLRNMGYKPSFYSVELNGTDLMVPKNFPLVGTIRNRSVVYVAVHATPLMGSLLPYTLERGASRAMFAAPMPSPATIWEYVRDRAVQLR
jgi:hypothetical protein